MGLLGKISLKFKLLGLLVILTVAMLAVYAYLALTDFRSDKMAYVFETNLSQSKGVANQIRSELEFAKHQIHFYLRNYNNEKRLFTNLAKKNFQKEDVLGSLHVYHWSPSTKQFSSPVSLKSRLSSLDASIVPRRLLDEALSSNISMRLIESQPGKWAAAVRIDQKKSNDVIVSVVTVEKSFFIDAFMDSQLQNTYVLNERGSIIISPIVSTHSISQDNIHTLAEDLSQSISSTYQITEKSLGKNKSWLIALSSVGAGGLAVMSIIPKSMALAAVEKLTEKSLLFLGFLFCMTLITGVLSSSWLTSTLKRLHEATLQIRKGNFKVNVDIQSQDEIGGLATGFNEMTKEIERLLDETAEKARMESELQTARVVQSTLFPSEDYRDETIEVKGFYEPASECGGDWWYYNQIGNRTYFWIGDATGHGVPAALVTSAARSASEIIEQFHDLPLSQIMTFMNRAIYGVAQGNVMMTFFLGCFDHSNGQFGYCNSSHDTPYLIPPKFGDALTKNDIIPLQENNGPRLGQDEHADFEETWIDLPPGSKIIFYTDGVTELVNAEGKQFGDRKFIRTLIKSFNKEDELYFAMENLYAELEQFRDKTPLNDDVTYFMFHYQAA